MYPRVRSEILLLLKVYRERKMEIDKGNGEKRSGLESYTLEVLMLDGVFFRVEGRIVDGESIKM